MKTCYFCNKRSALGKHLQTKQFICKDCLKQIPKLIIPSVLSSKDSFEEALKYHKQYTDDIFECTSSYGDLYLDELHGLFKIEDAIFNIMDLENVAFSCKKVKVISPTNVVANIIFACEIQYPVEKKTIIKFAKTIKTEAKCSIVKNDGETISWMPPEPMQIFQHMFYQTYDLMFDKYKKQYAKNELINNLNNADVKLAKVLFMISDDNYTKETVKSRRNLLLKAFHPDNIGDENATKRINDAYQILINNIP